MTPKLFLEQAKALRLDISRKNLQLASLQNLLHNAAADPDLLSQLDSIISELTAAIYRFLHQYLEISAAIDALPDPVCRALLSMRYLDSLTWEQIADRLHYSYLHVVHRLHPKALALFSKTQQSRNCL